MKRCMPFSSPFAPNHHDTMPLRSQEWFGRTGKDGFIYRAWMKNQGFPHHLFTGEKPVIGICNTWSELTPCNAHFRELAESVKRGIWEAGGFPLEFPVMSLGECQIKPTAMLFRNLASMDVEESLRANSLDGVVLMCGCDKTTPSLVMGACSVNIPSIVVSGGPMLAGRYQGRKIGTSDLWRFAEDFKTGAMSQEEFVTAEACMARSQGHCAVMGTASTMAAMVESLGSCSARQCDYTSRRFPPESTGPHDRDADCGDGTQGFETIGYSDAGSLRKRHYGECGTGWLNQLYYPPACHRRSDWR